jgi:small acid-soluble spore protein H (minor)
MGTEKAKTPTKVEVKYQGVPDWIEMNDEGTQTALVYSNVSSDEEPAWDLEEER